MICGDRSLRVLSKEEFIKSFPEPACNYRDFCLLKGHSCDDCYETYKMSFRR
jgi:hypothetical protein